MLDGCIALVYIGDHAADPMLLERLQFIRYGKLYLLEMKLEIACDSDRCNARDMINLCLMDVWQRSK